MENDKSHNFLRKGTSGYGSRAANNNRWLESGAGTGKLPPQALELEEAVLGALMIEKDALNAVIDILKSDSFYKEAHQRIYNAIITLFTNSEPIDLLTVTTQLRQLGELEVVGGAQYITALTTKVNSAANIEYHARVIAQASMKREMISVASKILQDAFEDTTDVFTLLDTVEQSLFKISESNIRKNYADMSALMTEALRELERRREQKDGLTGVPSGFTQLDRLTSGWQPTELVILAARPAMGKTAFVVSSLRNAAVDFGMPVAIFSLEMSAVQLVNRMISAEAEIDSEKLKKGNLAPHEWTQLHQRIDRLMRAPIYIDDTPALSILELRAKCRRLKQQHDIQMVVIDYLQLMQGDSSKGAGNREQEIASISRALKNLAKELNVPVIALSQLSRAVETRGGDKRPQLSDLRESGCVTGDTLIINAETGERMPMRQLAERTNPKDKVPCLGVNGQYKVGAQEITNAFYSGKKEVFELTTRSGKSIKASANHPFLKLQGWSRLDALRVGDKIAVPRRIEVSKPVNPLVDEELILLAHLIGDGCILPKQPYHYTSADEKNIEIVASVAQKLFGIAGKTVPQNNWQHLYLPSPYHLTHGKKHPITLWYEQLGLERVHSYNKRLPEQLFKSDNQKIALFLHHLWATDGNISWKKAQGRKDAAAIYYASSSKQLAEQVAHLLLRLGIRTTVKRIKSEKYRDMYHVDVQGVVAQLDFLQQVGCFGQRGQIIPELIAALQQIEANPNVDVLPKEVWDLFIKPLKEEAELSWRHFADKLQVAYSGTSLFQKGVSRTRLEKICQLFPAAAMLKALSESDVFWDEIVSIVPLGVEDVYDATVAGVHNFVANDIIIHNSIEQDADMVAFLYRPEYYGFTQDEAGNSVQGVGEVIVAKNRSGSLDTIQLRFIGKYTKFADLDGFYGAVSSPTPSFNPEARAQAASSFDTPPASTGGTFKSKANDLGDMGMNFPPPNPLDEPPF